MNRKRKYLRFALCFFMLLVLVCVVPLLDNPLMEKKLPSADGFLKVHFIDVGQADCSLLENGGSYFMVDTGEAEDREQVDAYLKKCGVTEIAGMILSHPHSDHIGLAAYLMEHYKIAGPIYMTEETYESSDYNQLREWSKKKDIEIIIPKPGEKATFAQCQIEFVGPIEKREDRNEMSIMAKITYEKNSFFFTGDGGSVEERDIIDAGYDVESDVLKVGHHGSETSSSYLFLREMNPKYAVISCGKDNIYGHPNEEVLSRFRDADTKLFRTDTMGSVTAVSDGSNITFLQEGEQKEKESTEQKENIQNSNSKFIGNKNSKVLHKSDCEALPEEKNRVYFDHIKTAVLKGYHPCQRCSPKD